MVKHLLIIEEHWSFFLELENVYVFLFLDVFVCSPSMKQLRDRVMKLREEYDQIYNLTRTEGKPSFNWGFMIDEKLVWKSEAFLAPVWPFGSSSVY